jgi:hypothetical protein
LQISAFAARVGSRNSGMQTELTKEIIERAFDEMGTLAAGRGITIEIAVYGDPA